MKENSDKRRLKERNYKRELWKWKMGKNGIDHNEEIKSKMN